MNTFQIYDNKLQFDETYWMQKCIDAIQCLEAVDNTKDKVSDLVFEALKITSHSKLTLAGMIFLIFVNSVIDILFIHHSAHFANNKKQQL